LSLPLFRRREQFYRTRRAEWSTVVTTGAFTSQAKRSTKAALDTAAGLHLAAAPTFAVMALVIGVFGANAMDEMCGIAGMPGMSSPLDSMASMYLLMAAFHLPPWLKLIALRRAKH
jgi:hypothetical protein